LFFVGDKGNTFPLLVYGTQGKCILTHFDSFQNYTFFAAIVVVLLEGLGLVLFIASQSGAKMNMPTMKVPKFSGYRRF
jgi:hypothetical protein